MRHKHSRSIQVMEVQNWPPCEAAYFKLLMQCNVKTCRHAQGVIWTRNTHAIRKILMRRFESLSPCMQAWWHRCKIVGTAAPHASYVMQENALFEPSHSKTTAQTCIRSSVTGLGGPSEASHLNATGPEYLDMEGHREPSHRVVAFTLLTMSDATVDGCYQQHHSHCMLSKCP